MPISLRFPKLVVVSLVFLFAAATGIHLAYAQSENPAQIELGAALFAENCAVCHGDDGQGRVGATLAKDWPSIRPDLHLRAVITNGVPGSAMPPWSQGNGGPLDEAKIDALVAYISSWETGGSRSIPAASTLAPRSGITPVPGIEGDPNNGALLFERNCAVCHGQNGEGRIGATLAKDWSSIRPDLRIRTTIAEGIAGTAMPAWSQAYGGPLAADEIEDLVAYVASLKPTQTQPGMPTPTPEPVANPFLTGWGGIIVLVVLFTLVVAFALWFQSRKKD